MALDVDEVVETAQVNNTIMQVFTDKLFEFGMEFSGSVAVVPRYYFTNGHGTGDGEGYSEGKGLGLFNRWAVGAYGVGHGNGDGTGDCCINRIKQAYEQT